MKKIKIFRHRHCFILLSSELEYPTYLLTTQQENTIHSYQNIERKNIKFIVTVLYFIVSSILFRVFLFLFCISAKYWRIFILYFWIKTFQVLIQKRVVPLLRYFPGANYQFHHLALSFRSYLRSLAALKYRLTQNSENKLWVNSRSKCYFK